MLDAGLIAGIPTVVALVVGFAVSRKLVSKATLQEIATYASYTVQAVDEGWAHLGANDQAKLQEATDRLLEKYGHLSLTQAETIVLAAVAALRVTGVKNFRERASAIKTEQAAANVKRVFPNDAASS